MPRKRTNTAEPPPGARRPSRYEGKQLKAIEAWQAEEPGVVSQAIDVIIRPVAWLIRKIIPEKAVLGALSFSQGTARWLTDTDDILRDAQVNDLAELRGKDLKLSDDLADEVHDWAIGVATAEGAATGAAGIFGAPIDIPALVTQALRCIHKIGACYGYKCDSKEEQEFVLGILSSASANTMEEKTAALAMLKTIEVTLIKTTWKKMMQNKLGHHGAIIAVRALAKQLGVNLTKRRALASIPVIGAAVGGSVNGWYLREVGWAARRCFQELWFADAGLRSVVTPSEEAHRAKPPRGRPPRKKAAARRPSAKSSPRASKPRARKSK